MTTGIATRNWRRRSGDVLAEYREAAHDADFWERQWARSDLSRYLARFRGGRLGYFERPFVRHLPRDQPVLEGGCGRGQLVLALSRRGYDAYGVEYAASTVQAILAVEPGLKIQAADLRRLPFPDGFFGGYISLGVVEHYWNGPDEILAEARRTVRPGGTLLLSVPHYSPALRRLAERLDLPAAQEARDDFYQFYMTREALESMLKRHGFAPLKTYYYDAVHGAKRAYPAFLRLYERSWLTRFVTTRLNKLSLPQGLIRPFAHMALCAAIRT
jgi:SAM-dependent methyltransferase